MKTLTMILSALLLVNASWGDNSARPAATIGAQVGGNVAPDGTAVQLDLHKELHLRNKGGSDGAGLCVFTSINHSAYWQNFPALWDFRDWMTKKPGGGWPEKVTAMIHQRCKEKGVPVPHFVNLEITRADLPLLELAIKSGWMPGVTYARSYSNPPRYGGARIAHMVTLVHAGFGPKKLWAILDNNYPGSLEWMTADEFWATFSGGGRTGWAFVMLESCPPPCPKN